MITIQGLKNCPEEMRADEDYVVSLWQHEVQRVMGDRISRSDDITWFERKVKDLTKLVSLLFCWSTSRYCL